MKYLSMLPVILLVACTKELPPEPVKVEPQVVQKELPPEPVKDTTEQSALPADQK